jgi:DNA-binding Lrp family transcriptional regulator
MSEHDDHPADYTGLHAFCFVDHVEPGTNPEEVVRRLIAKGKPPIMYASTVVGEYQIFVHARVRGIGELQDLIEDAIWEAGARCTWALESPIRTMGAKRKSPGLIALTRLKMAPGTENAARKKLVMAPQATGFVGVSKITGPHSLLLQMTGSSISDAERNIRHALQDVEGVLGTSTAFIDGDRTLERHGEIALNAMDEEPPEVPDEGEQEWS